jgi:hypothetical protein
MWLLFKGFLVLSPPLLMVVFADVLLWWLFGLKESDGEAHLRFLVDSGAFGPILECMTPCWMVSFWGEGRLSWAEAVLYIDCLSSIS